MDSNQWFIFLFTKNFLFNELQKKNLISLKYTNLYLKITVNFVFDFDFDTLDHFTILDFHSTYNLCYQFGFNHVDYQHFLS